MEWFRFDINYTSDFLVKFSKAFITLINNDIAFYQTTTSEISISYVIDADNGERAVAALYEAFEM